MVICCCRRAVQSRPVPTAARRPCFDCSRVSSSICRHCYYDCAAVQLPTTQHTLKHEWKLDLKQWKKKEWNEPVCEEVSAWRLRTRAEHCVRSRARRVRPHRRYWFAACSPTRPTTPSRIISTHTHTHVEWWFTSSVTTPSTRSELAKSSTSAMCP